MTVIEIKLFTCDCCGIELQEAELCGEFDDLCISCLNEDNEYA